MADDNMQEKTEPATEKKRREAREEGDVARSVELPSVFVLLGGVCVIYMAAGFMYKNVVSVMRDCFSFKVVPNFTDQHCISLLYRYSAEFFLTFAPVMITVFLMALITNISMVGFQISWKAIGFKFNKLDPIQGLKKKFSLSSVVELLKNIAKLSITALLAWLAVRGELDRLVFLYDDSVGQIMVYLLKVAFKIFIWVIIPMAAVALLDYMYQRWQFEEKLKMTKQEVKDEHKQTEGDPQVKSRIRGLQLEAARKRMMSDVPKADVIVTNPTHIAVAIKYDPLSMRAPKVVAKGAGIIAEKIKEIAAESQVPIIENKELARNLYKSVTIGSEIPGDFYRAVAEVLAYVFKMKGKRL
ncbi:MAG: flagellar biosynthesis protein FlhB [Proteobacteria bacterium]|nr:flagellar biosynthesis protein FlhB [Pseudomonadota bacterium]